MLSLLGAYGSAKYMQVKKLLAKCITIRRVCIPQTI